MWKPKNLTTYAARPFLKAASTAFRAVFIAEWGDITLTGDGVIAAKYHQPFLIFSV